MARPAAVLIQWALRFGCDGIFNDLKQFCAWAGLVNCLFILMPTCTSILAPTQMEEIFHDRATTHRWEKEWLDTSVKRSVTVALNMLVCSFQSFVDSAGDLFGPVFQKAMIGAGPMAPNSFDPERSR